MTTKLKIYSGGQLGADQAGLEAAKFCNIPTGGYAPKGYLTLVGPQVELLQGYGLVECQVPGYKARTWENVKSSDGTVRFAYNFQSPGEKCTLNAISYYHKPYLDIDYPFLTHKYEDRIEQFIRQRLALGHAIINIAGNRPGKGVLRMFHYDVRDMLVNVFRRFI
jgi:hypothetical protein